jgi:hypothetical protein
MIRQRSRTAHFKATLSPARHPASSTPWPAANALVYQTIGGYA